MTKEADESICKAFNQLHPVGSSAIYVNDDGDRTVTKIKSPAKMLGGHTPVIWLEDVRGAYLLSRIIPA